MTWITWILGFSGFRGRRGCGLSWLWWLHLGRAGHLHGIQILYSITICLLDLLQLYLEIWLLILFLSS